MRIVCPNCAAEYEVDAALIPDAGRDVQCSSCGHAWYLAHPDQSATDESEQALFEPPEPPEEKAPDDRPAPRPVDQAILDVLREEAARETSQRQAEARIAMESQPELGLDAGPTSFGQSDRISDSTAESLAVSPVAERIARLKGQAAPTSSKASPGNPALEAQATPKRSDLLPEIDEINSSLRPATEKRPGAAAAVAKSLPRKGGFARGVMAGLLIWGLFLVTYTLAPELAKRIPGLEPVLAGFVGFVDGVRSAIAEMSSRLIETMSKLIQ